MAQKTVIEGTAITASQLKEFFAQIASGAITRQVLQGVLEQAKKDEFATAISATFMTANYFVTRPGLWVHSDFMSQITTAYSNPLIPRGLAGVESFDIDHNSFDMDILVRSEMGGEQNVRKHAFTPDQIAELVDLQPEGVEGKLLTNGYSNVFYVAGKGGMLFVVGACWRASDREYRVRAFKRGGNGGWGAGDRIFRNTRALYF